MSQCDGLGERAAPVVPYNDSRTLAEMFNERCNVVGHKRQSIAFNLGGCAAWRKAPEPGSHDEMVARKLFDLRRVSSLIVGETMQQHHQGAFAIATVEDLDIAI